MSAEAWPTEHAATVAVEAAARAAYDAELAHLREVLPPAVVEALIEWDDQDATTKLTIRGGVLPVVWAALQALPDPRYAAWQRGKSDAANSHPSQWNTLENPYPFPAL